MLKRTLNSRAAIAIVIGSVIGSGIFMKPALMMKQLGDPWLLLSVWVVAGLATLFGALSIAEAASLFPETGGPIIYFQKMYGEAFSFLYGWAAFAVINTAGNASIAYVCAEYANYFVTLPRFKPELETSIRVYIPFIGYVFPLANIGVKLLTILIITLFTAVNYRSVKAGSGLQRLLTALKVIAIAVLIGGILTSGGGTLSHLTTGLTTKHLMGKHATGVTNSISLTGAYVAALAGAFWAYDGWTNIVSVAGEIKDPQKNIPGSLFIGLSACMVIYVLINISYLYALLPSSMAASSFVAADAATVIWGGLGGSVIALLVILSTAGAANANIFATARVTYAMGQESKLFNWAGITQPRYQTPGNALLLNGIWTSLMVISGSFDMLTDMLIFVSWFFYGMSALGIFVLRKKYAGMPREYKVPGYPIIPAVFVIFTTFFLVTTVCQDILNYQNGSAPIINSLLGVLITLCGLPIYWFSKKHNGV